MGIEIEHKYLVVNDKYHRMASSSHRIMQGYLSREPQRTVRIRVKDNQGFITIKGKNVGDTRDEFEYTIPVDDAMQLLNMCLPTVIEKTRYLVPFDGHTWEVDEFHGARQGLVVAEIEIDSSNRQYALPPFVGQNVTGNPDYYNSNL
ncbi:MAG: CYTH domain-containing protein [Muribaculaceae bacterium]